MKLIELKKQAHSNIVEALERHLEAAKRGDIVGFCIAYETSAGKTGYWVSLGEGCRPNAIVGQLFTSATMMAMQSESV